MPMGRAYKRKRLGRSVQKRGINSMSIPRAFPTTTLYGTFTGQQTLVLTGSVKSGTSLFQLFAFRGRPDLTSSSEYATNDATGAGVAFPAQLYRNIGMWTAQYATCQILGMQFELNFTKFMDDPPTFRAYVWSSTQLANGSGETERLDDLAEPVGTQPSVTDVAFDAFKILANTDSTVALLEQSRRVIKVDSVSSKAVARVDLDLSFYLPFNTTRRGLHIPKSHYASDIAHFGNLNGLTKLIANVTDASYGYANQVNVAIISTSADNSTSLSQNFFDNITVKTKIKVKFMDRIVRAAE